MPDAVTEPVLARYCWDEATHRRAFAAVRNRAFFGVAGWTFTCLAVLAAVLVIQGIALEGVSALRVFVLLVFAAWCAWPVIYTLHAKSKFAKDPFRDADVEWRFSPDEICATFGASESQFQWAVVDKLVVHESGVFVYLNGQQGPTWIPRSAFRAGDVQRLSAMARERVGQATAIARLRCADCGYDLHKHEAAQRCPECGLALAHSRSLQREAIGGWTSILAAIVASICLAAAGVGAWIVIFAYAWHETIALVVASVVFVGIGGSIASAIFAGYWFRTGSTVVALAYPAPIALWGLLSLAMVLDEGWIVVGFFSLGLAMVAAAWAGLWWGRKLRKRVAVANARREAAVTSA